MTHRLQTLSRRDVLQVGALGTFGLSLPHLLAARAQANPTRKPAKACIVLFMWGGPAHQDTLDPKPDAPKEYRGQFSTIPTAIPGVRFCEHLPMLARRINQFSLIRSMTHGDVNHTTAPHQLLTGRTMANLAQPRTDDWPNYGAVLSKLGRGRGPLPPYFSMMPIVPNGAPRFVEETHGQDAGWLGPVYHPMRIDADASRPEYSVGQFASAADVPNSRLSDRRTLLQQFDGKGKQLEQHGLIAATAQHYQRAFDLVNSPDAVKAFDLSQEPLAIRERYGMNMHGQSVLQARRLVEAGVPLVTVFWPNDGITNVSVYWDTHNRNFIDLKDRLCPVTDRATTALLDDLEQRGMLDETLVVWTGEMGRTPRVGQSVVGGAGAGADGRDHWPHCFSSFLFGGGIRSGVVHGSSDRYAAYPAENPVTPADFAATIYHCLGIDPEMQITDRLGRPLTLCEGRPIEAILR